MGVLYNKYLDGSHIYGCKNCKTHLAIWDDILSKNFKGRQGDAYLFENVVNVTRSQMVERGMLTGRYTVQDISCRRCAANVGWAYVKAHTESEEYKEGKYILEVKALTHVV
uniref:Protein yippee-like n=1 Tax=Blastobotrys adeninivorans TaxID=409370 RepID=A0A060T648_BLAAD